MNRILFIMILALAPAALTAQERPRQAVYNEFFGASGFLSVNYDTRFKANSHFGSRVGLACNAGRTASTDSQDSYFYAGPSITLEWYYLVGGGNHHLELGVGAVQGLFNRQYEKDCLLEEYHPHRYKYEYDYSCDDEGEWGYGYYGFVNVGYRYQPRRGFFLRAGINPTFIFNDEHGIFRPFPYPYLCAGFSF